MKWLQIFKPAPVVQEIEGEGVVKSLYKYWRWRIFTGMYVGYIFYYFSRKSFTCIMPLLMQDLGLTKSDLGILSTLLALSYGASKFLSGIISDRSNPRVFMSIGLILTGIINIFFGWTSSLILFCLLWTLNGLFQGWGVPPCAKLLSHWYSQKERGTWWGLWSSSHNVGGALIPIVAGFCAQAWGWRYGMFIPGVLCIGIGLFIFACLRDTPESLGLPPIEKFKDDYPTTQKNVDQGSFKEILIKYVLNNGYVWLLGVAYFFVYIVRGAINDWSPLFLMETRGYKLSIANVAIVWFEIGGLVGSLVAGWISDKIFKGRRGPINVIFALAVVGALAALWLIPPGLLFLDYALVFMIGFLIFGPQMLIGLAAVELSHKKAAGGANGFVGLIGSLGTAAAGYPLAKVMEYTGWGGFFMSIAVCGVVSALLLLPMWAIKSNPKFMRDDTPVPVNPDKEVTEV